MNLYRLPEDVVHATDANSAPTTPRILEELQRCVSMLPSDLTREEYEQLDQISTQLDRKLNSEARKWRGEGVTS